MAKYFFQSKNYLFFWFLGLVAFIILYPKFPLLNIQGTYVAVRLEDLLIASFGFLWFLLNLKNIKKLLSQTIIQAFLLFFTIGALSLISAAFITHSIQPHIGFLHWLRRVEMMSLFIIAATVVRSSEQLKIFLKVMLVVLILVILYGFGQQFLDFPVISTTNREFSKGLLLKLTPEARVNSTFAGHYDLAIYLSIVLVFLSSIFYFYKKIYQKLILATSGVLTFALLGLSAARVSFAAALFGMVVSLFLTGKRLLIVGLVIASVLAVVTIPALRHRLVATITVNLLGGGGPKYTPSDEQINFFTPDVSVSKASKAAVIQKTIEQSTMGAQPATLSADIAPGEPINTEELGVYRSFNIRLNVEWPRALRAFYKNPLLGTGYSSITIATDNDYLRSLGEVGLLGTASLGLIFFIIIKAILLSIKNRESFEKLFLIGTICSIIVVATTALFIDVLEASKIAAIFWTMLGIAWAVSKNYKTADD